MTDIAMNGDVYSLSSDAAFNDELSGGGGEVAQGLVSHPVFTVEGILTKNGNGQLSVAISQSTVFWVGVETNGTVKCIVGGQVSLQSSVAITDNARHHVALVVGDNGCKLFVDGNLEASDVTTGASTPMDFEAGLFRLRENFAGNPSFDFTGKIDEVAIWNIEKYSTNFTPLASPYTGNEDDILNLYHLDGNGEDSANSGIIGVLVPPNDNSILYSPYNWLVTSDEAKSINAGAYFRVFYESPTCLLHFDLSGILPELPLIVIRVDGRTIQTESISSTVSVGLPPGQDNTKHLLEVYIESTSAANDRWLLQQTAVKFTGIELAAGGVVSPVTPRENTLLIYGDSITEGVRTLKLGVAGEVARKSAIACYPLEVAKLTNSEVGVIGFGGTGLNAVGAGVPNLPISYDKLWNGESRGFSQAPDLCLWLEGVNDGSDDTVANGLLALNGMLSDMPATNFLILRPLNNALQEINLQNIVNSCDDPSRVVYKTTDGFWNSTDSSDGTHPYGYSQLDGIAVNIALLVDDAINDFVGSSTSTLNFTVAGLSSTARIVKYIDWVNDTVLKTEVTSFDAGGNASVSLDVPTTTVVFAGYLGANPPTTGSGIYGVTV